jgi:membrane protein CcdC involved in cytochrome C biogenesis
MQIAGSSPWKLAHQAFCSSQESKKMLSKTVITALVSLAGLAVVLAWRVREGRSPVTLKKIVMPPLGMATGFSMFLYPPCRLPWEWGLAAFVIGAVAFAYPLLLTSDLHYQNGVIMMKRSSAFFSVIIVLAVVRYVARGYFDRFLSLEQTGALFYLLAFGMIVRWRAKLYFAYRALTAGAPFPEGAAGQESATGE